MDNIFFLYGNVAWMLCVPYFLKYHFFQLPRKNCMFKDCEVIHELGLFVGIFVIGKSTDYTQNFIGE